MPSVKLHLFTNVENCAMETLGGEIQFASSFDPQKQTYALVLLLRFLWCLREQNSTAFYLKNRNAFWPVYVHSLLLIQNTYVCTLCASYDL
jgi:hypothetical protein